MRKDIHTVKVVRASETDASYTSDMHRNGIIYCNN